MNREISDSIVTASFSNGKNHTITGETILKIRETVRGVNEDPALKGIVLTGTGNLFSTGFDLPALMSLKNICEVTDFINLSDAVFLEFFTCTKPVVAAINGSAVAGGCILSMACDYRVAADSPKIKIGMSEIRIGLGLTVAQTEIMKFGLDANSAFREVMYDGRLYDVNGAKEIGLIDEITAEDGLMARAKEIIVSWIDNPGRAFSPLKSSFRRHCADLIAHRLKNENWQESFNMLFNPETRAALEKVMKMMG